VAYTLAIINVVDLQMQIPQAKKNQALKHNYQCHGTSK